MRFSFIFLLFLTHFSFAQDNNWNLVKENNDIQVFEKMHPESGRQMIKVQTTIKKPLHDIIAYASQISHYTEWAYACKDAYLVEKLSSNKLIYYSLSDLPFPMSDREVYIQIERKWLSPTHLQSISINKEYPNKPSSCVRVPYFHSVWNYKELTPQLTEVSYEVMLDPGGQIPTWLSEMFAYSGPFNSLEKLRQQIESQENN